MFENVVLRQSERVGTPVSAGQIAESLLYYQRVRLFIDRGMLFRLIDQLGTDGVIRLLSRSDVSAAYCEEMLGTMTNTVGALQVHKFTEITASGDQDSGPLKTPQDRLQYDIERRLTDKKAARTFTKRFFQKVNVRRYSGDHYQKGGISNAAKSDLLDPVFVRQAFRRIVSETPSGYDPGDLFKVEIIDSDIGLHVFHDIDFDRINAARVRAEPSWGKLDVATILNQIQDARADLALASFYGGDFVTSSMGSSLIQIRHEEMLRRTDLNQQARQLFTEIVLPDTPSLAEVIDSGERSMDEFFSLLDRAQKFKDWLGGVNPDEGLIRTYLRDVSSEGWIQKLPAKSVRYVLSSAIGAANPIAGLLAGASDTFLVEKMFGGWRPSHFINSKLSPFLHAG